MASRGSAILLLFVSSLASAQSGAGTVSEVTTAKPAVSAVRTDTPKTGAVKTSKIDVSEVKMSQPTVAKVGASEVKVAAPNVSKVTVSGGGAGGDRGGGPLTDQEQQLADQASKDDLNWATPDADRHQLANAASAAENDAATKAYAAAVDAGMDRAEAQKIAAAARQEVAKGPQPPAAAAPPATAPAPTASGLPEVIDMNAPTPAQAGGTPGGGMESTPPPGT